MIVIFSLKILCKILQDGKPTARLYCHLTKLKYKRIKKGNGRDELLDVRMVGKTIETREESVVLDAGGFFNLSFLSSPSSKRCTLRLSE